MLTFGGIGCGNMGGAILNGVGNIKQYTVLGYDPDTEAMSRLHASCGMQSCSSGIEVAEKSDYILIAVKPQFVKNVVTAIAPALTGNKILVSLAAGVSLQKLKTYSENRCPVVVIMPNTPAMVGEGCCALCFDDPALSDAMKKMIHDIFATISTTVVLTEAGMTEFSALIGSGPAMVFHMLESMVEAGLRLGFTYPDAKQLVEKLFVGSVRLAQATPDIPHAKLRMNVCSPKGSSIVGMNALDRTGVRGAVIDAVLATYARAQEMSLN